jgi:RNA polymerase sigma-70 factor (ECF subfamily)
MYKGREEAAHRMPPSQVRWSVLPAPTAVEPAPASSLEREVIDLFDQFRDRLLRYLLSFRLSAPDCEEVVQETFLALFQHLRRGKSRRNLRGWLFRVAHNLALKKRFHARRDAWIGATAVTEDTVTDPHPNPEDRLSSRQTQRRLQAVVDALPELDRRCLSLRAEGLRYREIAGVLGMSLGAVSISLARSLARIARAAER